MPNAKEIRPEELGHNIMLLGYTGGGKTSQILTLPGRTFVYVFDPSALHTLVGHDVDYELFIPTRLNLAAQSLTKGKSDKATNRINAMEVYTQFAEDLDNKVSKKFFDDYDNIVLDSMTTFSDAVMDRVQYLNDRLGQQPHQDDYGAQMQTIKSVFREFTSLYHLRMIGTGHIEFKQEEEGGKFFNTICLTGRLRTALPLLFSDIFICDTKINRREDNEYIFLTQKDKHNPQVRCTLRDKEGKTLPRTINVTIPEKDWEDPRGKCGLGRLILNHLKME